MFLAAVETVLDVLPKPGPRKLEREICASLARRCDALFAVRRRSLSLSLQLTLLAWLFHEQIYQQLAVAVRVQLKNSNNRRRMCLFKKSTNTNILYFKKTLAFLTMKPFVTINTPAHYSKAIFFLMEIFFLLIYIFSFLWKAT